jgi:rod shape determining protein RodA
LTRQDNIAQRIDWLTVFLFFGIALLGWLNIYAAVYDENAVPNMFDMQLNSGKQFLFICGSVVIVFVIMLLDFRFYETFGYVIYGLVIFALLFVLVFGREVAGSKSWFELGAFRFQPAEFAKFATALALAKFMGENHVRVDRLKTQISLFGTLSLPMVLIMLQGDTGTAMVFAVFTLVFYREGMSPVLLIVGVASGVIALLTLLVEEHIYLYLGIALFTGAVIFFIKKRTFKKMATVIVGASIVAGMIASVDFIVTEVMKPHQQNRVKALINPDADPLGYGWNVTQSKIAIGSGGFNGKGYLKGTQTKGEFVPEQSTDFIFCTIGEEHGWIGSLILISLFIALMLRVIFIAERQKWRFARVYGYSVACLIFFHFAVNIGMTIGLFPVVGIPLPFFSYGGSSLWSFTILLFILLKLDAHRMQVLQR